MAVFQPINIAADLPVLHTSREHLAIDFKARASTNAVGKLDRFAMA